MQAIGYREAYTCVVPVWRYKFQAADHEPLTTRNDGRRRGPSRPKVWTHGPSGRRRTLRAPPFDGPAGDVVRVRRRQRADRVQATALDRLLAARRHWAARRGPAQRNPRG